MYSAISDLERNDPQQRPIDLVICCGDFESVRNEADLACMACPIKFRHMVTFWKYYLGTLTAPYPTVFVHGNHEASNHLMELAHGGWVAPNIYYMGFAGVVNFAGIRVAGYSGIYDKRDFYSPRHEFSPLDAGSMRSLYHAREFEFFQLSQLARPVDVVVSHDWPLRVADHGDSERLCRAKPFFRDEVAAGTLGGSPAHNRLVQVLRPPYWFAAHLHVEFPALIPHTGAADNSSINSGGNTEAAGSATRFLALDKILPGRSFLHVFSLPAVPGAPRCLCYDEEWLAVSKSTRQLYPRAGVTSAAVLRATGTAAESNATATAPVTAATTATSATSAAAAPAAAAAAAVNASGCNGADVGVSAGARHADSRMPRPDRPVTFYPFAPEPTSSASTGSSVIGASDAAVAAVAVTADAPVPAPYPRFDFRPTVGELAWVRARLRACLGPPLPPSVPSASASASAEASSESSSASESASEADLSVPVYHPIPATHFYRDVADAYRGQRDYRPSAPMPPYVPNLQTTAFNALIDETPVNFAQPGTPAAAAAAGNAHASRASVTTIAGDSASLLLERDLAAVHARLTGQEVDAVAMRGGAMSAEAGSRVRELQRMQEQARAELQPAGTGSTAQQVDAVTAAETETEEERLQREAAQAAEREREEEEEDEAEMRAAFAMAKARVEQDTPTPAAPSVATETAFPAVPAAPAAEDDAADIFALYDD